MAKFITKHALDIFSLCILATGVWLLNKLFAGYDAYQMGKTIGITAGRTLVFSLVGFLALNLLRKRVKVGKFQFWLFCSSVSFSLSAVHDTNKALVQNHQLDKAQQELSKMAQAYVDEPTVSTPRSSYSNDEYGDFAQILELQQESFAISNKVFSDLNGELAIFEDLFLPKNLCDIHHIRLSKMRLSNLSKKINSIETTLENEIDKLEILLQSTDFEDNDFKRGLLKGFREGRINSQQHLKTFCNIERALFAKCDEILDFLTSIYGSYSESQEGLKFQNSCHEDQYKLLLQDFIQLGEEEEAILKTLAERQQTAIDKMSHLHESK